MEGVEHFVGDTIAESLFPSLRRRCPLPNKPAAGAIEKEAQMRDEMFDRDYQAGRDALNDGIDKLVAAVGTAFRTFHNIQFRAPWDGNRRRSPGV